MDRHFLRCHKIIPNLDAIILSDSSNKSLNIVDSNNLEKIRTIAYNYPTFDQNINRLHQRNLFMNFPKSFIIIPDSPLIITYCAGLCDAHIWNIYTGDYAGGFSTQDDSIVKLDILDTHTLIAICNQSIKYFDFSTSMEKYLLLKKLNHAIQTEDASEFQEIINSMCVNDQSEEFQQLLIQLFNNEKPNFKLLTAGLYSRTNLQVLKHEAQDILRSANSLSLTFLHWLKRHKMISFQLFLISTVLLATKSEAMVNKFKELYGIYTQLTCFLKK